MLSNGLDAADIVGDAWFGRSENWKVWGLQSTADRISFGAWISYGLLPGWVLVTCVYASHWRVDTLSRGGRFSHSFLVLWLC